jgi:hypothetical protein
LCTVRQLHPDDVGSVNWGIAWAVSLAAFLDRRKCSLGNLVDCLLTGVIGIFVAPVTSRRL